MKEKFLKALEDKDFSELFRKGGVSFLFRIAGQIIGFLLTLLIAHEFGAKGLGEYLLIVVVLKIFSLFAKAGLDTATIRFTASFASQNKWETLQQFLKKTNLVLLITSVFFSSLMFILADKIGTLLQLNEQLIKLFSFFILPTIFFAFYYQSLRGLKKIAAFSFFYRVSQVLFTLIIVGILLQFSQEKNIIFYAYLLSLVIASLFAYLTFKKALKKSIIKIHEEIIEQQTIKKILLVSLPLMFAQSAQMIMAWTDKLMLGNMMSTKDVGIYGVAFKLSMFASIALMAINSIASPKFAELYAEEKMEWLKKVVQQSTKMIFWATLPLIIIFFLFPSFFLGIFGEEFKLGVNAFLILSIGMLISAFSGSVGNLLQMTGRQFIFMKVLFVGALFNIGLNYFLIPNTNPFSIYGIYGINGAAVASMLSVIIWNLTMVYFVKRDFGFYTFYIPLKLFLLIAIALLFYVIWNGANPGLTIILIFLILVLIRSIRRKQKNAN